MVELLDISIADDTALRRLQLVELVLTHCSSVLWPKKPEKRKMVPSWTQKLRNVIRRKSGSRTPLNGDADGTGGGPAYVAPWSMSPQKGGQNGLRVASADIILCKEEPQSHRMYPTESPLMRFTDGISPLPPSILGEHEDDAYEQGEAALLPVPNVAYSTALPPASQGQALPLPQTNGTALLPSVVTGRPAQPAAPATTSEASEPGSSLHHSRHSHPERHLHSSGGGTCNGMASAAPGTAGDGRRGGGGGERETGQAPVASSSSSVTNSYTGAVASGGGLFQHGSRTASTCVAGSSSALLRAAQDRSEELPPFTLLTDPPCMNGSCTGLSAEAGASTGGGGGGGGGRYRTATPATRPDGEVVLVAATGSPLMEPPDAAEFPSLPLEIKRLSGGITNELFHMYDKDDPSTSVVVRVFGKETDRVISRESELFYQSLFIPTYAHGANFLVYEFLDQYETLPYVDMPKEAGAIADAMAAFQVRATMASRRDYSTVPAPRDSDEAEYHGCVDDHLDGQAAGRLSGVNAVTEGGRRSARFDRETNYTLHSITTWADQIATEEILSKVHPDKREAFLAVVADLRRESVWMQQVLKAQESQLGEGVCHNDLLSANFMRHTETGELRIIDFDYAKRNYLLFDIANHFNEYTGLECDYARYFPSEDHMATFVANYRAAMRRHLNEAHRTLQKTTGRAEEIIPGEEALFWTASEAEEAATVAHWTRLVKLLTLASNLSWSIWSLVQEAVSTLDVDFLDYAKLRLARYVETKEAFSQGF